MAEGADLWVDSPPDFSIDEGIARIRISSGDTNISIRCTPHNLLAGSFRAMRAYVEWDETRQEPVAINGDGGAH